MVSLMKKAATSLEKDGLAGHRAAVHLVLDHSSSMLEYYRSGAMQRLAEQVLALSANLDDDGRVPLTYFATDAEPSTVVSLNSYAGVINRTHERARWGGTNYAAAMDFVRLEHQGSDTPALVVFQTDGDPDSREAAENALRRAATEPLFFVFVGFGYRVNFLRRLDLLTGRLVDNAAFFPAPDPSRVTDEELYAAITGPYAKWLREARAAGVVQ
ncbi:toxic cation resistance protein [Streptomyces longwoodensis]|uniref:Toxic cation resistance protein n=2 Tax=Streptomyces longwoodensis TaxID=68231 RepID=A0A117QNE1_9ACTN|nr:toxic cation resistance protein [Streptomyces longwoodensis]